MIVCDSNKMILDLSSMKESSGENNKNLKKDELGYEKINDQLINKNYKMIKHVLEPGETLQDLQKNYGTDWRVIKKMNKIIDVRQLRTGRIILVPVKMELG